MKKIFSYCIVLLLALTTTSVSAHEIRPAYLEIKQEAVDRYQVLWKIPLLGNKAPKIDPIFPEGFSLEQIDDELCLMRIYDGIKGLTPKILMDKKLRSKD